MASGDTTGTCEDRLGIVGSFKDTPAPMSAPQDPAVPPSTQGTLKQGELGSHWAPHRCYWCRDRGAPGWLLGTSLGSVGTLWAPSGSLRTSQHPWVPAAGPLGAPTHAQWGGAGCCWGVCGRSPWVAFGNLVGTPGDTLGTVRSSKDTPAPTGAPVAPRGPAPTFGAAGRCPQVTPCPVHVPLSPGDPESPPYPQITCPCVLCPHMTPCPCVSPLHVPRSPVHVSVSPGDPLSVCSCPHVTLCPQVTLCSIHVSLSPSDPVSPLCPQATCPCVPCPQVIVCPHVTLCPVCVSLSLSDLTFSLCSHVTSCPLPVSPVPR